jgi:hypothetical protein
VVVVLGGAVPAGSSLAGATGSAAAGEAVFSADVLVGLVSVSRLGAGVVV